MHCTVAKITGFDTELIEELTAIEGEAFDDGGLNRWSFPVFIRHGAVYVLECDGEISGIADIVRDWASPELVFIYNFVVKKECRGKGLAGPFLTELIARLEADGIHRIQLTVSSSNEPALRTYFRAGFEKIAELKDEYGVFENRLLLELDVRKGYGRGR